MLAAHALVASFLGATTVKAKGLHGFSWAALVALLSGLIAAALLLSNWKLRFAVDAPYLYVELYGEAARSSITSGFLPDGAKRLSGRFDEGTGAFETAGFVARGGDRRRPGELTQTRSADGLPRLAKRMVESYGCANGRRSHGRQS